MATFVLVPGAWLGGWCWTRVAPLLEADGHDVYRVTLTGLGERSHLGTPETGLDTHIQDVVNLLQWEDLSGVILVGHSYSGFVTSGVADRVLERLGHLVFIDTGFPSDGEAMLDGFGPDGRAFVEAQAQALGDGWRWPLPPELGQYLSTAGMSEADLGWFRDKATGQPLKTLTQPLRLSNPAIATIRRTYVWCSADQDEIPADVVQARSDPAWRFHELETGHWPMISTPRELAAILNDVAEA